MLMPLCIGTHQSPSYKQNLKKDSQLFCNLVIGQLPVSDQNVGHYRLVDSGDKGDISITRSGDKLIDTWANGEAIELFPGKCHESRRNANPRLLSRSPYDLSLLRRPKTLHRSATSRA